MENLAEILKDCPKGMELDCTLYNNAELNCVTNSKTYPIKILIKDNVDGDIEISLTKEGFYNVYHNPKCVIFPKGKTTWEGFVPPCKFKDGDILKAGNGSIFIYRKSDIDGFGCYCGLNVISEFVVSSGGCCWTYSIEDFATEEEKQKLFDAIKANGYKWNAETKTLEKLVNKNKFKVGAKITNGKITGKIRSKDVDSYQLEDGTYIFFNEVHNWELVPNKFDISTLKPFDKVLYRMRDGDTWCAGFYSFHKNNNHFIISNAIVRQCIPYEDNKHLLGTTDDCEEYYKTWE